MKSEQSVKVNTTPVAFAFLVLFIAVCTPWGASTADSALLRTAIDAELVIKTAEPDSVSTRLMRAADSMGGFMLYHGQERIRFRLPVAGLDSFLTLAAAQGYLVSRDYTNLDLSQLLVESQARLDAKQALLKDYLALLRGAKAGTIFAVERSLADLRGEIEMTLGQRRKLLDQASLANVTLHFRLPDRHLPQHLSHSAFEWINTLDLYRLQQELQNGRR